KSNTDGYVTYRSTHKPIGFLHVDMSHFGFMRVQGTPLTSEFAPEDRFTVSATIIPSGTPPSLMICLPNSSTSVGYAGYIEADTGTHEDKTFIVQGSGIFSENISQFTNVYGRTPSEDDFPTIWQPTSKIGKSAVHLHTMTASGILNYEKSNIKGGLPGVSSDFQISNNIPVTIGGVDGDSLYYYYSTNFPVSVSGPKAKGDDIWYVCQNNVLYPFNHQNGYIYTDYGVTIPEEEEIKVICLYDKFNHPPI